MGNLEEEIALNRLEQCKRIHADSDTLVLNQSLLTGITNGIDDSEWDPSSDEHIAAHYSTDDLSGKVRITRILTLPVFKYSLLTVNFCEVQVLCKIALQKELGLLVRPDCPLVRSRFLIMH